MIVNARHQSQTHFHASTHFSFTVLFNPFTGPRSGSICSCFAIFSLAWQVVPSALHRATITITDVNSRSILRYQLRHTPFIKSPQTLRAISLPITVISNTLQPPSPLSTASTFITLATLPP